MYSTMYIASDTIYLLSHPFSASPQMGDSGSAAEDSRMELFIYSTKGEFRSREKLTDLLNLEQIDAGAVYGFTDNDGDLWICVRNKGALFRIQPDGRQSMKISIPQNYPFGFMRGKQADELIAALQSGDGLVLRIMNTRTRKSEDYPIREFPGVYSVFPGNGYDALVVTQQSVFGVTLGDRVIVKELLPLRDLVVDAAYLMSIEDHEDGSLSAILMEPAADTGERVSLIPRTSRENEGLTLACLRENDYIKYAVNRYNQEKPDNKITIKEYYDKNAAATTEEDALNRLNSDLMDGTAGDIVCLDGISFAGGTRAFLESGIFLDLYELMNNDPEFHKEDYFTDVFRINETDGKLFRLVPFFSLNTKFGKVDDIGETTHIDESLLWETEPVESLFGPLYRRKEFIHDLLVFSLGDLQNREAALYDTAELTRYIEVAGDMPDWPDWDENGEPPEEYQDPLNRMGPYDYHDGKVRFFFYSVRGYTHDNAFFTTARMAAAVYGKIGLPPHEGISIHEAKRLYPYDVPVTYSGFPVKEGCGSALVNCLSFAVSAGTEASEEAWEFLKYTLSEEYQSIKKLAATAVPVRKSVFQHLVDRMIAYETEDDDPYMNQCLGFLYDDSKGGFDVYYWFPVLKQYMVDEFLDLLPEISKVDEVDPNVEAVVTEEINKYCDGRQTAEEAARNIAERAKRYADEHP